MAFQGVWPREDGRGADPDDVPEPPDTEAAQGGELQSAGRELPQVEAVEAQKASEQPLKGPETPGNRAPCRTSRL